MKFFFFFFFFFFFIFFLKKFFFFFFFFGYWNSLWKKFFFYNYQILFINNIFNNSNNNNSNSNNSNSNSNSNNNNSNNSYINISNSIENNVYVDSSVCEKVFNFLLGGDRSINNSTREWKDLFKCQMKSGAYSDTPFLVVTAALLQSIIPIAIGQQWSLFNRFKSNRTTYYQERQCWKNSKTGQQG